MFQRIALLSLLCMTLLMSIFVAQAQAAVPETRLRARMGGSTLMSGKADYRERQRNSNFEQRFSIEIEDAAPNTTFDVHVNGQLFGTVTSNGLGRAELEFRTATPDDNPNDEHPPLTDFPRLADGDTITVGPLSGIFRVR